MTNAEFRAWRERLGLTWRAAAEALGMSERAVYNYGGDAPVPLYIELACCEVERRRGENFGGKVAAMTRRARIS